LALTFANLLPTVLLRLGFGHLMKCRPAFFVLGFGNVAQNAGFSFNKTQLSLYRRVLKEMVFCGLDYWLSK